MKDPVLVILIARLLSSIAALRDAVADAMADLSDHLNRNP